MVCSGKPIFGEAIATDMRFRALLGRVVCLKLAFPSHLAAVPLGTRRVRLGSDILFFLPQLDLHLGNGLDRLHHGCGVQLGAD